RADKAARSLPGFLDNTRIHVDGPQSSQTEEGAMSRRAYKNSSNNASSNRSRPVFKSSTQGRPSKRSSTPRSRPPFFLATITNLHTLFLLSQSQRTIPPPRRPVHVLNRTVQHRIQNPRTLRRRPRPIRVVQPLTPQRHPRHKLPAHNTPPQTSPHHHAA